MCNLNYNPNEPIYEAESQTLRTVWLLVATLVVAKGMGFQGRMDREVGVSRCKLLYTEWINNKVLPTAIYRTDKQ